LQRAFAEERARQDHHADEAARPVRGLREHGLGPALVPGAARAVGGRMAGGVDADAASVCSPPPCGEGLGVGVVRCGTIRASLQDPPPQPSPTRGEGADRMRRSAGGPPKHFPSTTAMRVGTVRQNRAPSIDSRTSR
jgi:hypothetical protein